MGYERETDPSRNMFQARITGPVEINHAYDNIVLICESYKKQSNFVAFRFVSLERYLRNAYISGARSS